MRKLCGMTLPFMGALVLVGCIALASYSNGAFSQIRPPQVDNEKKTFPLFTPIPDQVLFCSTQESAVRLAEVMESNMASARALLEKSPCGVMTATITYTRLVHQAGKMNVFEFTVGSLTAFTITDWKQNGLPI